MKKLVVSFAGGAIWVLIIWPVAVLFGLPFGWRLVLACMIADAASHFIAVTGARLLAPNRLPADVRERNIARVMATGEPCQPSRDEYGSRCEACNRGPCTGAGPKL